MQRTRRARRQAIRRDIDRVDFKSCGAQNGNTGLIPCEPPECQPLDVYGSIKAKYGFDIPPVYQAMETEGWFEFQPRGAEFDPFRDSYLWIPEAEWLRPQEILEYECPPYQRPGFVPFAFTGAGEHWCWWPAQDSEAVVFLPDGDAGVFDAANFNGSIYRRLLSYAIEIRNDEADEARRYFALWARRLREYFLERWIDTLNDLAQADIFAWEAGRARGHGFLDPGSRDKLIARDLAFPRLGETFEWTTS
jgi:hypothetical protein